MGLRVKGQETSLNLIGVGGVEDSMEDVKSSEIQFDRDILSEGYLGQTTEQKDDIFKGISGKVEFHVSKASFLDLINRIQLVTKRRLPGEQFELVDTYVFPDGQKRRIIVPNVKFGAIPISNASREDFVTVSFDFAADDARIIAA